ncbi:hypothetical protein DM785_02635 [Deinococcus actinosclerus]|nr:hypothetical protein DM785_02635 [Deinococcus actinosclerus]
MSLTLALAVTALVDDAATAFTREGEAALLTFHEAVQVVLARGGGAAQIRENLNAPATALWRTLAGAWFTQVNAALQVGHDRLGVPDPALLSEQEALDFFAGAAYALVNAALLSARVGTRTDTQDVSAVLAAWDRQYERGGAFVALRGTMRGATPGTLTTLVDASLIDAARSQGGWIFGAYNPLDERTGDLDRRLVLNRGEAIVTARGRTVRSIPGLTGKYLPDQAWVPGPPRLGGDTHDGCRCLLIPERAA